MRQVWFCPPVNYWYGWRTLAPWFIGGDEWDRRVLVLGWCFTGRILIAISKRGSWFD